jgi:predicted dehydrogenase
VIGYGYWGPNLVRNFAEVVGSQFLSLSDLSSDRLAIAQRHYPGIRTTTNCGDLLADPHIEAVAIATPVSTHYDIALQALKNGKHVLVEKPIAATSTQAAELIEAADRRNRVLMVGHTFVYTGAVRKIRELVAGNQLGTIYYYDSVRVNLGLFRHDVNVIWDLATHDLSIMDYVLASQPCAVSATGISHLPGEPENIAYLTLFFEGSLIAHLHVNWLAPVKLRRTLIGGSEKMIVYDDLEGDDKVKVYDKGVSINHDTESRHKMLVGYRTGDMWAPQIDTTEALRTQLTHFIRCIEKGEHPITGGDAGLRVVRILEAATQSMSKRGEVVELSTKGLTR